MRRQTVISLMFLVPLLLPSGCFRLFLSLDSSSDSSLDVEASDADHDRGRSDADERDGDSELSDGENQGIDADGSFDGDNDIDGDEARTTCIVTTENNDGPGSLRECLTFANATPGRDVVTFEGGVFSPATICLEEELPALTDPEGTVIDGSGATVMIDGGADSTTCTSGFVVEDGFTIESDGNILNDIEMRNFNDTAIIIYFESALNTISSCTIHDNYYGVHIGGSADGPLGNVVDNCHIYSNIRGVFITNADDNTITRNIVENNEECGLCVYGQENGSSNNFIGYNRISGNQGNGIILGDLGTINNRLVANVIRGNAGSGISTYSNVDMLYIYHNTIDSNEDLGILVRYEMPPGSIDIRNNIVSSNISGGIGFHSGFDGIVDYNLYYENTCMGCTGASDDHSVIGDPMYVSPPTEYNLTECTSPAIEAGVDLGADQPDLNGPPAPPPSTNGYNGFAPDMGAYESGCVSSS